MKQKFIKIISLVLLLCFLVSGCGLLDTSSDSQTGITELKFGVNEESITLNVGQTRVGFFIVKGNRNFSIDDIVFHSSDEAVAVFEYDETALTTYVYYKIKAVGVGTATVYADTIDGVVKTPSIVINVKESNSATSSSLNTNSVSSKKPIQSSKPNSSSSETPSKVFDLNNVPAYSGSPYVAINGNKPTFTSGQLSTVSMETYGPLDSLGRCTRTLACIGKDLMPTEERGNIGQIKPSGWHTVKYDCVDGKYLYNRCHLIGYQLSGENANEKNLITGTRYMNVEGMLPFENMVADYVVETGNHVMYRVTPIFKGNNLLATGVHMEAYSVEDKGDGISFNVFVYNVQPGVIIDYATGASRLSSDAEVSSEISSKNETTTPQKTTYVLNTSTKKFHLPSCYSVKTIKPENRAEHSGDRNELIANSYSPCKNCNP